MASHRAPASPIASQPRVLVCVDAPVVRALMAGLGRSHTVKLTASAEEALTEAPGFAPDLVITDLLLPGMDGRELVRRLRAIPAFADVPMVLLTAADDAQSRTNGFEAGADDFLVKPVRERELLARVASLLRLRRTVLSLSQRTRALEEANRELASARERLAALDTLAAEAAHDVDDPLSLVTSGAAALLEIADAAARLDGPVEGPRFAALMAELHAVAAEVADGSRRLQETRRSLLHLLAR